MPFPILKTSTFIPDLQSSIKYQAICVPFIISNELPAYSPVYAHFCSFNYLFGLKIFSVLVLFQKSPINSIYFCTFIIKMKVDVRFRIWITECNLSNDFPKLQFPLFINARETLILLQYYPPLLLSIILKMSKQKTYI
jgi:hypothetical protein